MRRRSVSYDGIVMGSGNDGRTYVVSDPPWWRIDRRIRDHFRKEPAISVEIGARSVMAYEDETMRPSKVPPP